jgi:mono/diheme cytochrome c family protein
MKKNRIIVGAVCAAAVTGAASCDDKPKPGPTPPPSATVAEPVARPSDWYGDSTTKTIGLEQGWTPQEIEWFYTVTQGSELMPYDMFLALEQADNEALLRAPRNMDKFRYLIDWKTPKNPDDLPVGFVKNGDSVGMVCAACHTTQINYKGTGIRIEGGPAMADFGGFMNALIASVEKTIQDTTKFDRFAVRVLGPGVDKKADLLERLKKVRDQLVYSNNVNMKGVAPYGFARLDAFGRIYNRVITLVDPTNGNPANAPVSYPFLWDTSQLDYVQWPGNAPNANLGELQRNIGEVIGVFASVTIDTKEIDLHGYKSSVNVKNLTELAVSLRKLQSPLWPATVLPPLDAALVQKGSEIYAKECGSCHLPIQRADPNREVRGQMYGLDIIKTDPTMANNSVNYKGKTGILEGKKSLVVAGDPLGKEATAFEILTNLVAGVLENNIKGGLQAEIIAIRDKEGAKAPPRQGKFDPKNPFLAYKARPLNGIWATAPFLHNGSVPTLFDLMLPQASRPKVFYVGRREFDPKKVGILTDKFDGGFEFDTSIPGNSNAGHEYGLTLSDADRWAVVEYVKSL